MWNQRLQLQFLSSWWWAVFRPKHVEQLRNTGIINSTTRLHLVGSFCEFYIMMHGSMNIKWKLYKRNAAIWFNKICRDKELTPTFRNIRINGNNRQSINAIRAGVCYQLNQEIKFLYVKKQKLNEQLYKHHKVRRNVAQRLALHPQPHRQQTTNENGSLI